MLHLNRYYQDLYRQTDDPEVKKYLAEKLVQAENVLFALRPMYMTEAAQALDVHLSTVSRAVKDKYLQCRAGGVPPELLFLRSGPRTAAMSAAGRCCCSCGS